jgi:hypothetical protein
VSECKCVCVSVCGGGMRWVEGWGCRTAPLTVYFPPPINFPLRPDPGLTVVLTCHPPPFPRRVHCDCCGSAGGRGPVPSRGPLPRWVGGGQGEARGWGPGVSGTSERLLSSRPGTPHAACR